MRRTTALIVTVVLGVLSAGCATATDARAHRPDRPLGFVVAAGTRIPVDVPVITFRDPGGFDGRAQHRWFTPHEVLPARPADGCDTPRRFSERRGGPPTTTLEALRERVTQLVLHYDAAVTSANCFRVLHDLRGLSVHFLLDVDGTLYQTLDLTARARHAGTSNDASIGIEIAHPGAWPTRDDADRFYADGGRRLAIPSTMEPPRGGPHGPERPGWFEGTLNGSAVVQRDFTAAQYASLERLVAALRDAFPALRSGPPTDASGAVSGAALPEDARDAARGVLGHVHVSPAKVDPGPAFDWSRLAGPVD